MKKLLLSVITLTTLSISAFGQSPQGFKYQAVVRDGANTILNNQSVGMSLEIQQGSIGGTAVYTETFATTTNAYGLVNLEIGSGTTTDDFSMIDWANGPYFIETSVDVTGGTSYVVMGTSQLMSVPYALYANWADSVANDMVDDADNDPINEVQDLSLAGNTLSLSSDPTTVDLSGYLDNTDAQTLSIVGSDLTISGGNTVTLPGGGGSDNDWAYFSGTDLTGDIYHTGNVALGTVTNPDSYGLYTQNYEYDRAAIRGTDQNGASIYAEGYIGMLSPTGLPITVYNIGVFGKKPALGADGAGVYGWTVDDATANYGGLFVANGTASGTNYGMYASASGATTNYAGYFAGNVYTTGSYLPSDRKLKENIKPYTSALDKLLQLGTYTYDYKDAYKHMNLPEGNQIGLIAQEVQALYPNLTTKAVHQIENVERTANGDLNETGITEDNSVEFISINYTGFVPVLIESIKEQQTQIEDLKSENDALKQMIIDMESRIKALEDK